MSEEERQPLLGKKAATPGSASISTSRPRETDEGGVKFKQAGWRSCRETTCCAAACLATLSMGFVMGYSSPALPSLQEEHVLTRVQASWFTSLVNIGAIFGGPFAGFLAERFGRKLAILSCSLPYILGWLLILIAFHPAMLYAGRTMTGFAAGMAILAVPLYVAETASKERRGTLAAGYQISTMVSIVLVYVLGIHVKWRWLAAISCVPPFVMVCMMVFATESPRWLLSKQRREMALQTLFYLREWHPEEDVLKEYEEMEKTLSLQEPNQNHPWSQLFNDTSLRRPLFVGFMLMVLQQFCGIGTTIFYTNMIFEEEGFHGNSHVPTIMVSSTRATSAIIMMFLVDRCGRRPLFIIGGLGMALGCVVLGAYFYLHANSTLTGLGPVSVAALMFYNISYSIGWGAIPWLVLSEVFPVTVRSRAVSVATAVNWLCSFTVTKSYQPLKDAFGNAPVFWGFSAVSALGVVFGLTCLTETRGKSLEEIAKSTLQEDEDQYTCCP